MRCIAFLLGLIIYLNTFARESEVGIEPLSQTQRDLIHIYQNELIKVVNTTQKSKLTASRSAETKIPGSSALVFVSFSMPEQSVIALLRDAQKIHASVIIRGLIDNSFKTTFQRVTECVQKAGGGGVELNPLWFKQFNITQVPTVVVLPESGSNYDIISGDIPLSAALRQIAIHGEGCRDSAQQLLTQLEESSHA